MEQPTNIDEAQVKHIAQLSRLAVTDEEAKTYAHQLGDILNYASHLPELTDKSHGLPLRMEEDEPRPTADPHDLFKNAVAFENGYLKVPAILDRSES